MSINKNRLQKLSTESEDDILELSARLENGTYSKRNTAKPGETLSAVGSGASGSLQPDTHPLEAAVSIAANGFYADLKTLMDSGSAEELRAALRSFIDALEALYAKI